MDITLTTTLNDRETQCPYSLNEQLHYTTVFAPPAAAASAPAPLAPASPASAASRGS
jgi:hypothetical protein